MQLGIDAYGWARAAEANGWIERALMLTEGGGPSEGRALALALRAHVAMLAHNDPREARVLAAEALTEARAAGSSDVEITALALEALALEGLARVCEGAIDEGMGRLDLATAAAVAGEVSDIDLAETICCYLIDACKRVRDLERAAEWCTRAGEIAARFEDRFLFAVCRIHHADILVLVSVGHQSGLFDAMAGLDPASSERIAEVMGLDERYVREWLAGMTVGGFVEHDPRAGTYGLPREHATCLTRAAGPDNLANLAQYVPMFGELEQQVLGCFRQGGGVPYSAMPASRRCRPRSRRRSTTPA
ncbi:MAG TPA: hypothetical protein VGM33_12170 [Baekduia sp.]